MGRPTKEGLDYFPLDVDFFNDEKVRILKTQHGATASLVLVELLCRIYRQGYFYEWSEAHQILLAGDVGQPVEYVREVVAGALKWDFFSHEMFREHGILTSVGIQRRFVSITKTRHKQSICDEYSLMGGVSAAESAHESESDALTVSESAQSKVKESKVKESILGTADAAPSKPKRKSRGWEPTTPNEPPAHLNPKTEPLQPCPDPSDPGWCWMTASEWKSLCEEITPSAAGHLAMAMDKWAKSNRTGWRKRTDHCETLKNWDRKEKANGNEFAIHPEHGPGYFKAWVIEKFKKDAA